MKFREIDPRRRRAASSFDRNFRRSERFFEHAEKTGPPIAIRSPEQSHRGSMLWSLFSAIWNDFLRRYRNEIFSCCDYFLPLEWLKFESRSPNFQRKIFQNYIGIAYVLIGKANQMLLKFCYFWLIKIFTRNSILDLILLKNSLILLGISIRLPITNFIKNSSSHPGVNLNIHWWPSLTDLGTIVCLHRPSGDV
jgi:hypothetical protein